MTNKNKKTFILAQICSTMLASTNQEERTKAYHTIVSRLRKGIRKQYRLHYKDALNSSSMAIDILSKTLKNFDREKKDIFVDESAFVIEIVNRDSKSLEKHYGMSEKIVGNWSSIQTHQNAFEFESNARLIVNFIINEIDSSLCIEDNIIPLKDRLAKFRGVGK